MLKKLHKLYLRFKYRKYDDTICCCGASIGSGGDICYHGGCRSLKEYIITKEIEKYYGN